MTDDPKKKIKNDEEIVDRIDDAGVVDSGGEKIGEKGGHTDLTEPEMIDLEDISDELDDFHQTDLTDEDVSKDVGTDLNATDSLIDEEN